MANKYSCRESGYPSTGAVINQLFIFIKACCAAWSQLHLAPLAVSWFRSLAPWQSPVGSVCSNPQSREIPIAPSDSREGPIPYCLNIVWVCCHPVALTMFSRYLTSFCHSSHFTGFDFKPARFKPWNTSSWHRRWVGKSEEITIILSRYKSKLFQCILCSICSINC